MNTPCNVNEFILHRESMSDDIYVIIGKDSYVHDRNSIKHWFNMVGVSPIMVNQILDAVWNMRKIRYIVSHQRLMTL